MGHGPSGGDGLPLLIAQGILQEKGAEIGDGTSFLFGATEQRLMNVITEGDRNATRLTLKHAKAIIHY
jgi:hypothetical protein